jgi:hypothetical protein
MLMFNTGPQHGEGIGEYRGDLLYHASLSSGEYLNLIRQSGFETIDHVVDDPHAGGRTVWLCTSGEVSAEQLSEEGRRASRPSHNASSLTCS